MQMPQAGGAHGEAAVGLQSPLSPPLSPTTAAAAELLNGRWNPTREQVAALERLYNHGLRTPSQEQVLQITGRLREHGPVEAKNVFYWFQNHKSRQRQRQQRQGSVACSSGLLRRAQPLLAPMIARQPYQLGRMPASPPVMQMAPPTPQAAYNNGSGCVTQGGYRAPYYMPQASSANAAGYFNLQQSSASPVGYFNLQQPSASSAAGYFNLQQAHHMAVMYPRMEIAQENQQMNPAGMHQAAPYGTTTSNPPPANVGGASTAQVRRRRKTLELFPLRPTFLQRDTASGASLTTSPMPSAASGSVSAEFETDSLVESTNSNAEELPFYDFFGLQSAAGR